MRYLSIFIFLIFLNSCLSDEGTNSENLVFEVEEVINDSLVNDVSKTTEEVQFDISNIELNLEQKVIDNFACSSTIILKNHKTDKIDSIKIKSEPVGSNFGLSCIKKLKNHYILSKYGDYDGSTIIINSEGMIFQFEGGDNFYDEKNELIFSIYSSDLNGLNVYDLKSDSIIFSFDDTFSCRPSSFYYFENNRLLMICHNYSDSQDQIWEFEFDLNRVMQLDLDQNNLADQKEIPKITEEIVNCKCKTTAAN